MKASTGHSRWVTDAAIVIAVVGAALLLRWAIQPITGEAYPYITLYPAVATLSWWRGARAGLPALVIGGLCASLLFSQGTSVAPSGWVGPSFFVLGGGVIVVLGEVHRRALERSRASEAISSQLAAIVASSDDAIISERLDGTIVSWNEAALRLYGYTAEDMIGKPIGAIVPPDKRAEQEAMLDRIRRGERVDRIQTERVAKNGRRVQVSITLSPVRDAQGTIIGASKTARDIGPEIAAAEALRATEARFRVMGDAAPVLIWMSGPDKLCNWFNRAWLEFTGRTLEQEMGNGWAEGVHPEDLERCLKVYTEAFDARRPFEMEYRLRRHDGVYRWIVDRGVPLLDEAGAFSGYIGSCFDITDRHEAEARQKELLATERAARAEAERVGRLRDEFLSTLSHELRTPLSAILGWTHLVRRPERSAEDVEEALEVIERNARAQSRVIEDLLDMGRISAGKLRLDLRRVDLGRVVGQALASARPAAEAKRIALDLDGDEGVHFVHGDATRLQQIVWNLLSNAIKFTPREGRVRIMLGREGANIRVLVSDTGKGMRREFLEDVFQRFRQEDASTTRQFGGLGLGLAIVKQLVEIHGGSVRAESEGEGKGATFIVELPAVSEPMDPGTSGRFGASPAADARHGVLRAAMGIEAPAPSGPTARTLEGIDVVLVDDEPDARALAARVLRDAGANVRVAGSAREALALVESRCPRVLLSDIGMPEMDGYALIRLVRALPPGKGGRIAAAAVTAFARVEDKACAIEAGFQMHVAKPVEPEDLVSLVERLASLAPDGASASA